MASIGRGYIERATITKTNEEREASRREAMKRIYSAPTAEVQRNREEEANG
jgi:hypothetical protein